MRAEFPIALHPKTFQMTVGRLLAWPPNSRERSRSANFGGKTSDPFHCPSETPRNCWSRYCWPPRLYRDLFRIARKAFGR